MLRNCARESCSRILDDIPKVCTDQAMIQIILLSQHVLAAGPDETDLASARKSAIALPFFSLAISIEVGILLALLIRDAIAVKDSTRR